MSLFFILYIKFLFVLIAFYFLGKGTRSLFSIDLKVEKFETFFNVIVGMMVSTIVYSLIKSNLTTIMVISLPIFFYFFSINNLKLKKINWVKINFYNDFLPLLIISTFVFIYQAFFYFDFSNFNIKYLFVDNYTYSNIVSILHDFGVENVDYALNMFEQKFQNESMPYRYADLWLSSLIMDLANVSDIESFYLITLTILISLSGYFYFSILIERSSNLIKSIFISIILLFVSIAFIPLINPVEKLSYICETSTMGVFQQKLSFSAVFFLLGIYFWKLNRENSLLFFICVPVFYVAYLPAIWGGVFVYLIIKLIRNNFNINFQQYYVRLFFLMVFILLSYWYFYKVNGEFFLSRNASNFLDVPIIKRLPKELMDPNTPFELKSFISNFIFYSIPEVYTYLKGAIGNLIIGTCFFLPLFLLNYSNVKKLISELYFIFLILLIGLIFAIYKDGDYNNYQFYTNCLLLISLVISISFVQFHIKTKQNNYFIILIMLINVVPIFSLKYKISKHKIDYKFIKNVNILISTHQTENILCFVNKESFDGSFYSWVGGNILFPIKQLTNQRIIFSIANPEVFFEKHSSFDLDYTFDWNLITNFKKNNPNFSFKRFIKTKKIKFLLFYPNVIIPNDIKKNSLKTIRYNGYIFIKMK